MANYICEVVRGSAIFAQGSPNIRYDLGGQWISAIHRGQDEYVSLIGEVDEITYARIVFSNSYVRLIYDDLIGGGEEVIDNLKRGDSEIMEISNFQVVLQLPS
jgi:hypothetical protein